MHQGDFVRVNLINPMRTFGIQFRGRGFLCGRSFFAPVAEAASRLVLNKSCEEGKQREFLFDLPVTEIQKRAIAVRRCIKKGDMKGLRHIRTQYRLGSPLKELKTLFDMEKKEREVDRDEIKLRKVLAVQEDEDFLLSLD